ncbi:DUF4192 domain-containing protein [Gordonia bronchialis]|uniref:DUF4192 domain-containing protein n=1 Tax=Gordonia bronchialis TaxID=2054 RepID=UPI001CBB48E2|nr:DUF4192 domain-containing protein [Gordonia bronchialis]UAK38875.1 DUF4192 domain-containing protein [Gordonia bronchialis]
MSSPSPTSSGARLDATALLTAIPALLGFVPERSIIVVAVGPDRTIRATMRHDLVLDERGRPHESLIRVIENLGTIGRAYGVGEMIAIIADDRFEPSDARYRRVMAIIDRAFGDVGGLRFGFVANEFVCGTPWLIVWRPIGAVSGFVRVPTAGSGVLDDPHTCPTAVATAVRTGRRLLSSRSEMQQMLEPAPRCAGCGDHRAESDDERQPSDPADREAMLALIVDCAGPVAPRLDCATLENLERAITDLRVRDAALALAVTDLRDGAERLWRELTRRLRGRGRASAATLLAHLHYIGGEGAYAGVALDTALSAEPTWYFAQLLDSALRAGMRPQMLWEMIDDSYRAASDLGVRIPEPTLREVG